MSGRPGGTAVDRAAGGVAAGVLVVWWLVVGAPWLPPVAALGAALLTRPWRRRRSRHVARSLVVGAAVGVIGLVATHLPDERTRAAEWGASDTVRLPDSPQQVVRTLLDVVARGDGPEVCGTLLSPDAAGQLAAASGTPDCRAALQALTARVTDRDLYPIPDYESIAVVPAADERATADACGLSWSRMSGVPDGPAEPAPGPQLGRLDLARLPGQGYQVVGFTRC